jgi:myo-inositol-1(or 4)-monophosphatase
MEIKSEAYRKLAGNPKEGVEGGQMAHSLRALGTAALNYCMVAQGSLDIYWCAIIYRLLRY